MARPQATHVLTMRRLAATFSIALLIGGASARLATAQEGIATKTLLDAKNAFMDLKYKMADSLARRVIAYGTPLITPEQQLIAFQISIASLYPEETGDQHEDQALDQIKKFVAAGGKTVQHDLSWPRLDSLVSMVVRSTQPGYIHIGSRTQGAFLYVNGAVEGPISTLRFVSLPSNAPVKLQIKADKCAATWDTTVTLRAIDTVTVGRRNLACSP